MTETKTNSLVTKVVEEIVHIKCKRLLEFVKYNYNTSLDRFDIEIWIDKNGKETTDNEILIQFQKYIQENDK